MKGFTRPVFISSPGFYLESYHSRQQDSRRVKVGDEFMVLRCSSECSDHYICVFSTEDESVLRERQYKKSLI